MTEFSVRTKPATSSATSCLGWPPCGRPAPFSSPVTSPVHAISLTQDWQIHWFESLAAGREHWEQLPATEDVFLSAAYFALLDQLSLPDVSLGYAIFEHPDYGAFGLVLQAFTFAADQQLGKLDQPAELAGWQRFQARFKGRLAKVLRFRILAAGQLLLTGDHALRGHHGLDEAQLNTVLAAGLEAIAASWPERIHGIMLKDLPLQERPRSQGYHALPVQPNMVVTLDPAWRVFDDYLDAMSSKYRVRVRRARKKGDELQRRLLSLAELQVHQRQLHALYQDIAKQSDFNAVVLPEDYFTAWKTHFPDRFQVWGYFVEEELIGFSTAIYNGAELEAHFLGLEQGYSRTHQLYLNMLYDLVAEAIAAGSHQLVLSRTALEIKSSVGARPENLYCWMRSRVAILNPLVPIVARFIAPLKPWEERHPFK
ncbi:MAG: hypothetical protein DA408_15445 [Bacteroidetes bacterium]|nr:MAG: hypothetical protein DA408_15445 [Bacteroidota bacterium]